MSTVEVLDQVSKGYRMPNPADSRITCPPRLYDTMRRCWADAPDQRPSFADLHAFFNRFLAELDTPYQLDDDAD